MIFITGGVRSGKSAFAEKLATQFGEALYSNAGGCSPFIIRKNSGTVEELKLPGAVLGAFKKGKFSEANVNFETGDAIVFYTDGIFEFACIYNAYVGYGIADKAEIEDFLNVKVDTAAYVWKKLVQMYYGIDDITDIENKAKVIGLARVVRRTLKREPNNTKLIEASHKGLLEAIDNVDSLIIE